MVKILSRLSLGPDAREEDLHGTELFPCEIYETSLQMHTGRKIPEEKPDAPAKGKAQPKAGSGEAETR